MASSLRVQMTPPAVFSAGDRGRPLAIRQDEQHVRVALRHGGLLQESPRLVPHGVHHPQNGSRRWRPPQQVAKELPHGRERHHRAELCHQRHQRQREAAGELQRARHRCVSASPWSTHLAPHRLRNQDLPELRPDLADLRAFDLVKDVRHHVSQAHPPPRRLVREEQGHQRRPQPQHPAPQRPLDLRGFLRGPLGERDQLLHVVLDLRADFGDIRHWVFSSWGAA